MYKILESVISTGGYKLAEIQHKVKKMYLLGDLTEDQMDALLSKASAGVSPDAERPETIAMLQTLLEKIEALDKRVKDLETAENPEEPEDPENPDTPEPSEYPAWEPWNGISNQYQPGSIVTHNGQVWESIFQGQNVWEPGAQGTENLWVIHTEE
jgi:hypothetical protein